MTKKTELQQENEYLIGKILAKITGCSDIDKVNDYCKGKYDDLDHDIINLAFELNDKLFEWVGKKCIDCEKVISNDDIEEIIGSYDSDVDLEKWLCSECYVGLSSSLPSDEDLIGDESWEDHLDHEDYEPKG